MERLARQSEHRFAEGLVLRGVRVDERCDVFGVGLPVDGELRLADELADACADHVDADDGAVDDAHDLDGARGAEDRRLAVAGEVVVVGRDLVGAVLLDGLGGGEPDGGDLGVGVGDLRDVRVFDDDRESPAISSATKIPCWNERCASCSPGTMSPTA